MSSTWSSIRVGVSVVLATVGGGTSLPAASADATESPPLPGFPREEAGAPRRVHDPSTIVRCGEEYWFFCTGVGVRSYHSRDRVNWAPGPPVFTVFPAWTREVVTNHTGHFWAPDIIRVGDRYLLYYSVSSWGKNRSAIGLATNATLDPADPAYGWKDEGIAVSSTSADDFNAIDPSVLLDRDGRLWMAFGSFWSGIKLVELDPTTGKRKFPDAPVEGLAYHEAIEAPCLYRRGDQYYLFLNWGLCCRGTNSTYEIRVGRSTAVTGPYVDREGLPLMHEAATLLLGTTNRFIGPGHAGIFQVGEEDWLSYHYYDGERRGRSALALRPLRWTADGWPEVVDPVGAPGAAASGTGRIPAALYVSKLGDNSDGSSWAKAFHTIQAALNAVPDAEGGHRIVIRPGAYDEANLFPAHKGAPGAYNVLEGDWDGSLGSGTNGWVVVDSGAPRVVVRTNPKAATGNPTFEIVKDGDPDTETGLKSVDWWGPWRCDPSYSAVGWDRWVFRRLYGTGSEGGIGWDMTCEAGAPFSAVVEDCVGVGRFAGACVIAHVNRPEEPVVFRRCYFVCMDVWGDAGGVYVRAHNPEMPATPDAVFEDCTILGADNALQVGYPGFVGYTRVRFKGCRLIVLNFSQPHGTPATGVVYSDLAGKYLHVDFEDCTLMGYKALGARDNDLFSYTTTGTNRVYVQYRQSVPAGFERLRFWPIETFQELMPARFAAPGKAAMSRPRLTKLPLALGQAMENTPVVWQSRPLLVLNHRDDTKNQTDDYTRSMYLYLRDLATGQEVARFGEGHSFANAYVNGSELNVFASEGSNRDWFQSLYRFSSTNLTNWNRELVIPQSAGEHLFNASVCRDDQGYVMAYESDRPVQFCFKFARSTDLSRWQKLEDLVFTGANREYSACPALRYVAPYYYVIYLHAATPGHPGWISFLARSRDLATWELSPFNPILEAAPGEGINNSDVDLFEWEGNTYLYYATGDQATWGAVRVAQYAGPMCEFFAAHFPTDTPTIRVSAR